MNTRERIIETAEVLFAKHGYEGTSLRDITEHAGVNIAAVNYHFGSKEGLLTALLDRVIAPINAERLDLLAKASTNGTPDLRQVLTAFLLPDLHSIATLRGRNPELPRFVSRMYSDSSPLMEGVIGKQFREMRQTFGQAFARALPDLEPDELSFRVSCLVGVVVYMFASVEAPGVAPLTTDDVDRDLHRLLTMAESILTAPVAEVATA